ncbi:MAG TPA: DUF5011 domain-containing protein [Candidatus Hydrogenedens sp.]|nr:DUF5011 domain-containing protein [Candidatus Hydrogenedens sp.]
MGTKRKWILIGIYQTIILLLFPLFSFAINYQNITDNSILDNYFLPSENFHRYFAFSNNQYFEISKDNLKIWIWDSSKNKFTDPIEIIFLNSHADIIYGSKPTDIKYNCYSGNQPETWIVDSCAYEKICTPNVYDGIDLEFYFQNKKLEFDFIVNPQADLNQITWEIKGGNVITYLDNNLTITNDTGYTISFSIPKIYQSSYKNIETSSLQNAYFSNIGRNTYQIIVEKYDQNLELVIDPILTLSTYMFVPNANKPQSLFNRVYLDYYNSTTDISIIGVSAELPKTEGIDIAVFLCKLSPTIGKAHDITFLNGNSNDYINAINHHSDFINNHIIVAGKTNSTNFPISNSIPPFNTNLNINGTSGEFDGFLTILDKDLKITFSTLIGGTGYDSIEDITINENYLFFAGNTSSTDLQLVNSTQTGTKEVLSADGFWGIMTLNPLECKYMTKLNAGELEVKDIEANSEYVYLCGNTSIGYPVFTPAIPESQIQGKDIFVQHYSYLTETTNPNVNLLSSFFFGGSYDDILEGGILIYYDTLCLAGNTYSNDIPNPKSAVPEKIDNQTHPFLTVINPDLTQKVVGTYYVFGNGTDILTDIKTPDKFYNEFFIAGYTNSNFENFSWDNPTFTSNPFNTLLNNGLYNNYYDAMIWRLQWNSSNSTITPTWGTFLGGSLSDTALSIGTASDTHICIVGITESTDFPLQGCHSIESEHLPTLPTQYLSAFNIPGKIIYVNPNSSTPDGNSWETGFHTITDAINSANNYDEIWIKAGEYNERVSITDLSNIIIRGGFSGTETNVNNVNPWLNPTKLIILPTKASGNVGTPILNITSAYDIAIYGLIFENGNNIIGDGGALTITNSSVYISCSQFYTNTAYGNGGAVYIDNSSVSFTNCVFSKNSCSGNGSAIFANESSLQLTHCTLADNFKTSSGDISTVDIQGSTSALEILNSIIWAYNGNNIPQINYDETINIEYLLLRNSIIQNFDKIASPPPSINIIETEPLFMEYPSETSPGDLNLTLDSPAVNLGDPISLTIEYGAINEDIRRMPRINLGECKPDAGAFEIFPAPPPKIVLYGDNPLYLNVNEPYTEPGFEAKDGCNTDITDLVDVDSTNINPSIPGEYIVTYSIINPYNQGEIIKVTRTVIVISSTGEPQITLIGPPEVVLECGINNFNDPGATAKDPSGNDITDKIKVDNNVNINNPGSYTIVYSIDGTEEYTSATATRTVQVIDTTPPQINLIGDTTIVLPCNSVWTELGYDASDSCSSTVDVTNEGEVNLSQSGIYVLTYTAFDESRNHITVQRTVVVDCDGPNITLIGSSKITLPCNTVWNDPGYVTSDSISDVAPVKVTGTVNTSQTGTYTITYEATDTMGNSSSVQRIVVVDCDTTPLNQCESGCINSPENSIDNDGDGISLCIENCYGTSDQKIDSDEDGMSDDFEINYTLNPSRPDAEEDADLDGYTNLEEYLQKTNPIDSNSPWTSYYVSPDGNDDINTNNGSLMKPWKTINYAISNTPQTTMKIAIILLPGDYHEIINLKSNTVLRGITISGSGEKPTIFGTINGAENSDVFSIDIRPPSPSQQDYILLNCGNNIMHIKNVRFLGTGTEIGISVDGDKPYYTVIEQCTFENLKIGIQIGDSIPIIRRCIFRTSDSIDTVSPTCIYIKDNQGSSNPSNSLGDINDPNTGWNTFELESGKAIINERSTPIIADNNDWGTEDTTSLVEGNVKINYALKKGSALVASSLSFVVWNASNKQSIQNATISLSPSVYPPLSQNTNGVYTFSSIPEGTYNVTITAPSFQNHSLTTTVPAGNIKSESVALKPVTTQEGSNDGTHDGSPDGSVDGSNEGAVDGTHDGSNDGTNEGQTNEGEPTKPVKKCGCNQKGNKTSISEIAIISLAISMLGMYRPKKNKRL